MMQTAEIAAALGGAHGSGKWWRCRCPVHGSRGPSLALRDGERALVVKCWAGCDPREVLAELRRRGLAGGRALGVRSEPHLAIRADAEPRIDAARRLWKAAQSAFGGPVVRYIAGRRIALPPPPSLRYAPALRRADGSRGPAMVARIDSFDGELIGVHRTWLARDENGRWLRESRAMLGRAAGGAVRLAEAEATLLVGEGIETCLAAMQATAQPAWAALSTSGLVALTLPLIARSVVILADNDASGAGQRAAYAAAQRWLAEGRRVRIALPPQPSTDMADVLAGRGSITDATDAAA